MTLRLLSPVVTVLLASLLLSCKSDSSGTPEPMPPPGGSRKVKVTFDSRGNPVRADGSQVPAMPGAPPTAQVAPPDEKGAVQCKAPADWKSSEPTSPMRQAQYAVPRAQGDGEDGELAVFYFGPTGAGGVAETFERWMAAFDAESTAKAKRSFRKLSTGELQMIEVAGTFDTGKTMTGAADDAGARKEAALLGAILQTSEGPYYFKLTGPPKTVAAARPGFDKMLDSCSTGAPAPASSPAASAPPAASR
jgi:hypothetical protein